MRRLREPSSSSRARFSAVCAAYHAPACAVCATRARRRRGPRRRISARPTRRCAGHRLRASPAARRARRWGRSGRTRAYSPSPGAPRGNARRSARAPPPRRGVPAPTSPAGGRACSRARRARARARAPTRAAPPSPRSARPGRRRQPVGFHECSAGARRGVRGARWTVVPIPRSGMPKMVPPSLDSAPGRKGTAGEGTHPRRAPLGVVHERQSVPGVEALRAGEAVAPDQRENHGRRPGASRCE